MWVFQFRFWDMLDPRNLNVSTAVTLLSMMVSGESAGFLLKSMIISTVLSVLSSRLFRLHQTASSLTSCMKADSSPSWMRQMSLVSSANFRSLTEVSLEVQSLLYREKSSGERTHPWPVLVEQLFDINFPGLPSCCLSVKKLVIHWQIELGTELG